MKQTPDQRHRVELVASFDQGTREVMTHNFTKSPQTLGRKGNCTKPKIRHIACHFFEKSTQGVDPFSTLSFAFHRTSSKP